MNKTAFLRNLEDIIEIDPGSLNEQTNLADLTGWDSMAIMGFIAFVDEEIGSTPSPAALKECKTVNDLMMLVSLE